MTPKLSLTFIKNKAKKLTLWAAKWVDFILHKCKISENYRKFAVPSLSVKIFDSLGPRYQISVTFWFFPEVSGIDNCNMSEGWTNFPNLLLNIQTHRTDMSHQK